MPEADQFSMTLMVAVNLMTVAFALPWFMGQQMSRATRNAQQFLLLQGLAWLLVFCAGHVLPFTWNALLSISSAAVATGALWQLHKALKGGDAPFEDEKFSYLVLTRQEPENACQARVLRHAQIAPGRITFPVCEAAGERTLAVTKKDPLWKRVRKIKWGERL